jgi:hypothetical protein
MMITWKEVLIKIIDMITEDKLMAMLCLTLVGILAIMQYPISESLPVLTAIIGAIGGFVTGVASAKKD